MSVHVEIFVRPLDASKSASAVAADIGRLTDTELTSDAENPGEYVGVHSRTVIEMFVDHGLENDDYMPFADHPYMIRFCNLDHDADEEYRLMKETYEKVIHTGRYSTFATRDIQVVLSSDIRT
jgi:hypothetical protein